MSWKGRIAEAGPASHTEFRPRMAPLLTRWIDARSPRRGPRDFRRFHDTFPVMYLRAVAGMRSDVRIVNLRLANASWHVDQMRRDSVVSGRALEAEEAGGATDRCRETTTRLFAATLPCRACPALSFLASFGERPRRPPPNMTFASE